LESDIFFCEHRGGQEGRRWVGYFFQVWKWVIDEEEEEEDRERKPFEKEWEVGF